MSSSRPRDLTPHNLAETRSRTPVKERASGRSFMPPPAKPSIAEEEAFMAKLLTNPPVTPTRQRGLSSHKPSPRPSHSERGITSVPNHQLYSAGQVDLEEEVSGWDWDALSDYVPSPKKSCDSPRKAIRAKSGYQVSTPSVVPKYAPDPFIRCCVQTVTDTWTDGMREKVSVQFCVR